MRREAGERQQPHGSPHTASTTTPPSLQGGDRDLDRAGEEEDRHCHRGKLLQAGDAEPSLCILSPALTPCTAGDIVGFAYVP